MPERSDNATRAIGISAGALSVGPVRSAERPDTDLSLSTRRRPTVATNDHPPALVGSDRRSWLDVGITHVVAAVAAAASYGHMFEAAIFAGQPLLIARVIPITVDGLVLAALRRGRDGRFWLMLGLAVSVAANVLAAYPELAAAAGPFVSAWPPLALFGTHRLLHSTRPSSPAEGRRP